MPLLKKGSRNRIGSKRLAEGACRCASTNQLVRIGFMTLLFVCSVFGKQARCQSVDGQNHLTVLEQGELATYWEVNEAGLQEILAGTSGYIKLRNNSKYSIEDAVLYAEYFDASGRFCFSLVFSQEQNLIEKGPIAPNEIRKVESKGVGLFPASEPSEVRIYLVQQTAMAEPISLQKWAVTMRSPATDEGTISPNVPTLLLGSEVAVPRGPILDLLLASLSVNEQGAIQSVEIIGSLNANVSNWFNDFIWQNHFYPAMDGDLPKANQILVLVRANLGTGVSVNSVITSPHALPWVQSFASRIAGQTEVPEVAQIILGRPSSKVKRTGSEEWIERPPAPPGLLQVTLHNTEWSSPAFRWVSDQTMPNHLRRVLDVAPPNGEQ